MQLHAINFGFCLPVRTTASRLRTWPISLTTPSSDPSLASPSALRTPGKYVAFAGLRWSWAAAGFSGPSASLLPLYSGLQVILTAEVSGGQGSRIFISDDFGKSFTPQELPFMPLTQITYNPENSRVLTALSNRVSGAWRRASCLRQADSARAKLAPQVRSRSLIVDVSLSSMCCKSKGCYRLTSSKPGELLLVNHCSCVDSHSTFLNMTALFMGPVNTSAIVILMLELTLS